MAEVDATLKAILKEMQNLNQGLTDPEKKDAQGARLSSLSKEDLEALEGRLTKLNELEGSISSNVAKRIIDRQKEELELAVLVKKKQELLKRAHELTLEEQKQLDNYQKQIDAHKRLAEYKRDSVKFGKEMGSIFKSYEKHSFFNVDTMASLWSVMNAPVEFMKNFAATGIINYVDAVLGLVFQINKMETGLVKSIGASEEFSRSMSRVYTDVRATNVSMQDLQKTSESLFKTFTDFTMIDRATRDGLVKTTSIMVQAGHSADALSKSIQNMTKAFGVSAEQSQDILVNLDQFAREIGVAPAQMTEDFANMGGSLAKLGSDGVKAFKDLARTSKITGLEMQKLLNITDKFDTFEGAAEQAGKLNAALGGNFVNAMDLLTATDPVERFGMIRDSLQSAGLEFDNMSYYQRKFFTESLGLEDVSDLAKIMSGDMSDFSGEVNKTSADYAKMAEAANRAADFQQRFNSIMMRMIPLFEPLLNSIDRFLDSMEGGDGFIGALKKAGGALEFLGGAIEFVQNHWKKMLGAFILWKTLIPMAGFLTKMFLMLKLKAALASGAFATMGATIGGAGTAAAPAVPILLSIAAVVTSIGLAAAGVAAMFAAIDIGKLKALGEFVVKTSLYSISFGLVALGFTTMAGSVAAFAVALRMVPLDKLKALQEISTTNAEMQGAATGGPVAKAGTTTTAGKVVLNVDTPVTINLDGKKVAEGTYRFYKEFEKEELKIAYA